MSDIFYKIIEAHDSDKDKEVVKTKKSIGIFVITIILTVFIFSIVSYIIKKDTK